MVGQVFWKWKGQLMNIGLCAQRQAVFLTGCCKAVLLLETGGGDMRNFSYPLRQRQGTIFILFSIKMTSTKNS